MNADEIVGALRRCNRSKGHRCSECPVFSRYEHRVCKATVDRFAADLIESLLEQLAEREKGLEGQKRILKEKQNEPKQEPVKLYCVEEFSCFGKRELIKGKVYEFDGHRVNYESTECFYAKDFEAWKRGDPNYAACLVPLVSRVAKVGEYIRNNKTGEVCEVIALSFDKNRYVRTEVIALSFDKNRYVRTKVGNKEYNGDCADRKIEHPFDLLVKTEYLVLDGYKPEPEKAEPEYLSMRVVCVDDGYCSCCWVVGAPYKVINGEIRDKDGEQMLNNVTSLDDLNSRLSGKFIEFKGE